MIRSHHLPAIELHVGHELLQMVVSSFPLLRRITWCTLLPQTFNTLRSLWVSKSKREKQCGVVYSVKCNECDKEYVCETTRMLGTRFREQTQSDGNHPNSAIEEHTSSTSHHYTLDDTKILVKEDKWFPRKIWVALHIHKRSPILNRDHEIP